VQPDEEEAMRRIILAAATALALLSAGALLPNRTEAMTLAAPAGAQAAVDTGQFQQAAYICRRVWHCGYWGCGWRRACYWTRPYWRHHYYWRRPYWRY
jgi:hypothetical protein